MQVVGKINPYEYPCGWGVDTHVVCRVVQKLCPRVPLNIVRVVVTPTQLDVQPIFLCCGIVHYIPVEEKNYNTVKFLNIRTQEKLL